MSGYNLIRPLTARERLCLDCPLPQCDEYDPRCPFYRDRRRAQDQRYSERWQWLRDALRNIRPGEERKVLLQEPVRLVRNNIYQHIPRPAGYKWATRRDGDHLIVWLKEAT